jgi:hypothetical protein
VLGTGDFGDRSAFNASPAVASGSILVRSDRCLYRIGRTRRGGDDVRSRPPARAPKKDGDPAEVTEEKIEADIRAAPTDIAKRGEWLAARLREAGLETEVQPIAGQEGRANVIGKLKGATDRFIVVSGPERIPVPKDGTGLWIHPAGKKLHVHLGEQTTETVLFR